MWPWLLAISLCFALLAPEGRANEDDVSSREGTGQSPSLSFCQQRYFEERNGRLYCNWAVDFRYACFVTHPNDKILQAGSAITEPEVVGECDNGEPVIKLYHY